MGGEFTYQPKWDPIGFDPQPYLTIGFLGVPSPFFPGIFLENLRKPRENGRLFGKRWLKRTGNPPLQGSQGSLRWCTPLDFRGVDLQKLVALETQKEKETRKEEEKSERQNKIAREK